MQTKDNYVLLPIHFLILKQEKLPCNRAHDAYGCRGRQRLFLARQSTVAGLAMGVA